MCLPLVAATVPALCLQVVFAALRGAASQCLDGSPLILAHWVVCACAGTAKTETETNNKKKNKCEGHWLVAGGWRAKDRATRQALEDTPVTKGRKPVPWQCLFECGGHVRICKCAATWHRLRAWPKMGSCPCVWQACGACCAARLQGQGCEAAGPRGCKATRLQGHRAASCKTASCKTARLQGCKTAGLQGCKAARLQDCKAARLQGCKTARLQGCNTARLQGCKAARLQGCKAAGCKAARLQGCKAARLQSFKAARLHTARLQGSKVQDCMCRGGWGRGAWCGGRGPQPGPRRAGGPGGQPRLAASSRCAGCVLSQGKCPLPPAKFRLREQL